MNTIELKLSQHLKLRVIVPYQILHHISNNAVVSNYKPNPLQIDSRAPPLFAKASGQQEAEQEVCMVVITLVLHYSPNCYVTLKNEHVVDDDTLELFKWSRPTRFYIMQNLTFK